MVDSLSILLLVAAQAAAPAPAPDYFPTAFATPSVACSHGGGRHPILSNFQNGWYSAHLRAAGEPSLSRAASERRGAVETLRFTWLRTFDHPVIIRIETARGRSRLTARELSGAGGYGPGDIARRLDRALTAQEDRALHELLDGTNLFAGPPRDCHLGLDGSQWIFEGVDAGGYHFLDRWSPNDGPAHEVGMFLLGLTGWELGRVY